MAVWGAWKTAFDQVTLRADGDPSEIEGACEHGLDVSFSNYEEFWRHHVVPATNRPANFDLRQNVDRAVANMATVSHGIFCDVLNAEKHLARIRTADLGGNRFSNCIQCLRAGGDAMQKLDDLQRGQIQGELSRRLNQPLLVWTPVQWTTTWKPRYEKLSGYRNFLTHHNIPQVMLVRQPSGDPIPHVPHEDHLDQYARLSWPEQEARYRSHEAEWDSLRSVCIRVHHATVQFLNDAYGEIRNCLDPLLNDDDYQNLWGWDTPRYGRFAGRSPGMATSNYSEGNSTGYGSGQGFAGG